MRRKSALAGVFLTAAAALTLSADDGTAQFDRRDAIGKFYLVGPPPGASRTFDAVRIERVAPHSTVPPPPVQPMPLGVPLVALTGQITELPERQRIYFSAADAAGVIRLFEIDLLSRDAREVVPRPDVGPPYAVHMLAASDASKLYVQWFAPGFLPRTEIYDGLTLDWVGQTMEFRPDERATGFEHRPPYLWTLDLEDRPLMVDTHRDRVINVFDLQRWFGPVHGVVADAWHDLLLVRLEVGHDRYQVVDVVSGEIGPALDIEGFRHAQPRLALDGRLLVLIDMERRSPRRARTWAETAVATGGGAIYSLRGTAPVQEFQMVLPFEFPVSAVGTEPDPGLPGRLWVHVPGDNQRFDYDLHGCRRPPKGDRLSAKLVARWDPGDDRLMYRYRIEVDAGSETAAGAIAIRAGRQTERTGAPEGWGVDLIKGDDWVRWTNGLGPSDQDIAPGSSKVGFVIAAAADTRPGIAEYRVQGALGLPRGCESDDRFLKNSLRGYTIAPEYVDLKAVRKVAERLERLVDRACDIGWVGKDDCPSLEAAAKEVKDARSDRADAVARFLEIIANRQLNPDAETVLADAAVAVQRASTP